MRGDEPLSLVDHAWLRMERPTNPMMITALVELEERLPLGALANTVRERLLSHPRFTQRIVEPRLGRPRWSVDPDFALRSHLHRVGLPAPGDSAALAELVSDLMSTPLDRSRPLWQVHLVEEYGAGSAIIVRLHHCIADGIALVRLLLSLTDHEGDVEAPGVGLRAPPPAGALGQLRHMVAGAKSLAHMLALPRDPETVIHGRLGTRKCAAWSQPAPLEAIRAAAAHAGGTVNDVLLAALTGAVREYLRSQGDLRPGIEIRALVPVNLRRIVGGGEAGNRFGLVYFALPLGCATPAARLEEVHRRMETIKSSPEAIVAFGLLGAMGLASVTVERFGIELFSRKASAVVTNVPGPTAAVRLAGRRVGSLSVWAPASGGVGMTLSLMSYRGEVRLGVAADAHLVPEPWLIAHSFETELQRLTARA